MGQASIISLPSVKMPSAELNLGGTSTAEKMFVTGDATPVPIFLPLPGAEQLGGANARGTCMFTVRAYGRVTTSGTLNVTFKIHGHNSLTSTTITASQVVGTTGAISLASLSVPWFMEARCCLDVTSNKLYGQQYSVLGATVVAATALTNAAMTNFDLDANQTQGFVCAGTFGTGAAGNIAYLDGFVLEMEGR